jgi:ABC-2 type transport system ATP-binding protein
VVRERGASLLRLLDLADAADVQVADYSLGMTKKIGIAVALVHDPKVLFLDVPFAGVDPVARQVLERILRRFTDGGGTVVFSDHAMDVVERLCDHIMLIDHGAVKATGPTAELTAGRRLQDVFVELVGGGETDDGDLGWLGTSSD